MCGDGCVQIVDSNEKNAKSDGVTLHGFYLGSPNCPNPDCGAPPSEHHLENYNSDFRDGDVVCKCGAKVRDYDAG